MLERRSVGLLVASLFAFSACASPPAAASPDAGGSSDAAASPVTGDVAPDVPDLNDLRVPIDGWATDFGIASVDLGEFLGGGPPKDGIPSVDEPRFESIAEARVWMAPAAPVISLELDGQARAYPLAILVWHEIVNDTLAEVPVVVTFCPLCHTALVFERTIEGQVDTFGTTGNLRFSDLVMYDRRTESWWQQATGEAIVGTLTGTKLTFLPAQIISIADFAAAYPDGDVLSRDTGSNRSYGQNPYPGYDQADQHPFLFTGEVDGRLAAKEKVVTIDRAGTVTAIPYRDLAERGVIELETGDGPVVAFWTGGTAASLDAPTIDDGRDDGATGVFVPIADGRRLTFTRDTATNGPITDAETGSTWSITGRATGGPLVGSRLEAVVHGDHFWFAWAAFAPETEVWSAAG